jgi:Resolvase, N terminal domain
MEVAPRCCADAQHMWRGLEVWSRLISSWRWLTTHLLKLLRTTQSALSRAPRQNIERLLADVADGQVDVVLAFANDRLYRRVEDQLRLMRALEAVGGRIVTVNDSESDPTNAGGQLTVGVLADVGAYESKLKANKWGLGDVSSDRRGGDVAVSYYQLTGFYRASSIHASMSSRLTPGRSPHSPRRWGLRISIPASMLGVNHGAGCSARRDRFDFPGPGHTSSPVFS